MWRLKRGKNDVWLDVCYGITNRTHAQKLTNHESVTDDWCLPEIDLTFNFISVTSAVE